MYVAGTGRQIARPESLRDHQPGIVIMMNPAYKSELQQMVKKPGLAVQVESAWAETEP